MNGVQPRVFVIHCEGSSECNAAVISEDRRATYRCINHRAPTIAGDDPGGLFAETGASYGEDWI